MIVAVEVTPAWYLVLVTLASTGWDATGALGQIEEGVPDINQLGEALFTRYLYAFEITSILLVIAVVGAVLLARSAPRADEIVDPGQEERAGEVAERMHDAEDRAEGDGHRGNGHAEPAGDGEPSTEEVRS